jgi:hypothetical protein
MGISRRNTLIGIGTLIAGGGAVLGTGAFTTVQAERTVSVETVGDASAFLGLTSLNDDYVDDSGDTIQIALDGSENSNADGLNQDARSRFEDIVRAANNGADDVDTLTFSFGITGTSDDSAHEDALSITYGSQNLGDGDNILHTNYADTTLTPGDSVDWGVEIDLLDSGISDFESSATTTLTITAESA